MWLMLAAFAVAVWWQWFLATAVIAVVLHYIRSGYRQAAQQRRDEAAERAAVIERADLEHAQILDDDERGIYGQAWPAVRSYRTRAAFDLDSGRDHATRT